MWCHIAENRVYIAIIEESLYTVLQLLYNNNIICVCLYDLQVGDICSCP